MKAFFKASNPPLSNKVGGAKQTIRLYTFILPFWGSFFFAYCAFLASAWCESSQGKPKTGRRVALTLDATAVRRSALLKLAQRLSAILSKQVPHHRCSSSSCSQMPTYLSTALSPALSPANCLALRCTSLPGSRSVQCHSRAARLWVRWHSWRST